MHLKKKNPQIPQKYLQPPTPQDPKQNKKQQQKLAIAALPMKNHVIK